MLKQRESGCRNLPHPIFAYNETVRGENYNNAVSLAVVAGLSVLIACAPAGAQNGSQNKRVLGVTETARIEPEGLLVVARLDTGASTTSLDARSIRIIERDGRQWVLFDYHGVENRIIPIERPLVRVSLVRPAPSITERRPVVMMTICMGGIRRDVQVNLVDRSKSRTRLLIGRNFLIGAQIIVDSALEMTAPPVCEGGGA